MEPQHAVAIRAFDYLAALVFGVVAALSAAYLVPDSLPGPLAMVAGMMVGFVAALPLLGFFSFLLGGLELVMMSAQIGMLAGMAGAMAGGRGVASIATLGAAIGLVVHLLLHLSDRALRGEVRVGE